MARALRGGGQYRLPLTFLAVRARVRFMHFESGRLNNQETINNQLI